MTGLRACALASVASAALATVGCEPWDPEPRMQSFALVNAHVDVACEGCHPYEPPFTAEVGTCEGLGFVPVADPLAGCLACHECDRPDEAGEAVSIPHYPGVSCGTASCHALVNPLWAPDGGGGGTGASCGDACHPAPLRADAAPADDAHTPHLDQHTLSDSVITCTDCHGPTAGQTGHETDGLVVVFEALTTDAAVPLLPGAYDEATQTCSNTYCHALSANELGADPSWADGPGAAACGECHGVYPVYVQHPGIDTCATCHSSGGDLATLIKSIHIDGTCYGC